MRVRFDLGFDGNPWHGPLDGSAMATAGEARLGPQGFLDTLETHAGLSRSPVSDSERTATLVGRLVRDGGGFCEASARRDPFGTARTLLRWRDRLVLGGWHGAPADTGTCDRLADLARLTTGLPAGLPDRLRAVCSSLARRRSAVTDVTLSDPEEALPRLWRDVLQALRGQGAMVRAELPAVAQAEGDLAGVKGARFEPRQDGTLQLLRPQGPRVAAELVAAWIASLPDWRGRTVIISPDPTLDGAIRHAGLPALGVTGGTDENILLQVLPLTLALAVSPTDPQRALELLSLPISPVPRALARRLAAALHEWPAVGSHVWVKELESGLAQIEDDARRERVRERLATLFPAPRPNAGHLLAAELHRRADVVERWCRGYVARVEGDDPSAPISAWEAAVAHSVMFRKLLNLSGFVEVTPQQLRKLVDEATSSVPCVPRFEPEAGLHCVTAPAAFGGPVDYVVWWNFTRASARCPDPLPLTLVERRDLSRSSVELEDGAREAVHVNRRWARPLLQARRRVLLVCPRAADDGEAQHVHPLWDQVLVAAGGADRVQRLLVTVPSFVIAPAREDPSPLPSVRGQVDWSLPADASIRVREKESPSSVGSLVACSFQWTVRYAGELYPGKTAKLPTDERLVGSLVHELLARVLRSGESDPESAAVAVARHFDEDGPCLAAPLFAAGAERLRARARRAASEAAKVLIRTMHASGLRSRSVELPVLGSLHGQPFEGRPDLVVGTPHAILDLKWGGQKYHRQLIESGAAYQLAAYAYLTGASEAGEVGANEAKDSESWPAVGYFVLQTQRFLTTSELFAGAVRVDGPSARETWQALSAAVAAQREQVRLGRVSAPGQLDPAGKLEPAESHLTEDGVLRLCPPCRFCDYGGLCGHAMGEGSGPR